MATKTTPPDHVGRLKVRKDRKNAEFVIRAMFETWLLQALDKENERPSRLEITVSNEEGD